MLALRSWTLFVEEKLTLGDGISEKIAHHSIQLKEWNDVDTICFCELIVRNIPEKKPVAEATKMAKLMDCREKEDKKVWDALEKLGDEVAAAVGPRPGVGVVIQHP